MLCKSIYHWANERLNKVKEKNHIDIKITLFIEILHEFYISRFAGETLGCAILDTGHTKTFVGSCG